MRRHLIIEYCISLPLKDVMKSIMFNAVRRNTATLVMLVTALHTTAIKWNGNGVEG